MNVLMVLNRYYPMIGGAENQCRILMNQLASGSKINVIGVATHRYSKRLNAVDKLDDIDIYRLGLPGVGKIATLSFYLSLFTFLLKNKNKIDIVHVHTISLTSFFCVLFTTLFGKKTLQKLTIAGEIENLISKKGIKGYIVKNMIRFSISKGHVVVLTDEGVREIRRYSNKANYYKINNGIDCSVFHQKKNTIELREKYGLKKDRIYLGFVGRLTDVKGILELCEVVLDFNRQNDNLKEIYLTIMGSGDLQVGNVQEKIDEIAQNSKYVSLFAPQHQPVDFYNAIDFYVSNSKKEGLPNTVLEALACGKRLILSDIPPHVEIRDSNPEHSFIKIYKSIDELNFILNDILQDAKWQYISDKSLCIDERFHIDKVSNQYEELYQTL
ncbi:glycosyltransferase family 4 protein [Vibrio harveyi]|uniref:glycosyltransferase family 4 protein n=1 Tax=Vibrio harveyi TaxID=669 RepID=UPI001EEDA002|nr:glycosyltransferase family 4 protein [Vibrio harveyi]